MSDWPDLTPEDCGRWYPGTNVAFDRMLEVDGFDVATHFPAVEVPRADVGPYEMRGRDGGLFGINSSTYAAWAGNDPPRMMGLLETLEIYGRIERARRHSDCPLAGCEDFEGQTLVPVHAPTPAQLTPPQGFDYRGGFTYLGEPPAWIGRYPIGACQICGDRDDHFGRAHGEVGGRNLERVANGSRLVQRRPGFVMQRDDSAGEPTPMNAPSQSRRQLRREAREHLQRARPKRRLDGRRA